MQPLTVLRFEAVDRGNRQLQLGVAEDAERPHRAEPVAAVAALDGDEPLFRIAARRVRSGREPLPRELGAAEAPDRIDQLGGRGVVRTAVEGIDALVIPEADLRQHRARADALWAHLPDRILDLLREQRRVNLARWKELLDEFLVLAGEAIGVLVGEAGEFAAQRFPQRTAPVLL